MHSDVFATDATNPFGEIVSATVNSAQTVTDPEQLAALLGDASYELDLTGWGQSNSLELDIALTPQMQERLLISDTDDEATQHAKASALPLNFSAKVVGVGGESVADGNSVDVSGWQHFTTLVSPARAPSLNPDGTNADEAARNIAGRIHTANVGALAFGYLILPYADDVSGALAPEVLREISGQTLYPYAIYSPARTVGDTELVDSILSDLSPIAVRPMSLTTDAPDPGASFSPMDVPIQPLAASVLNVTGVNITGATTMFNAGGFVAEVVVSSNTPNITANNVVICQYSGAFDATTDINPNN